MTIHLNWTASISSDFKLSADRIWTSQDLVMLQQENFALSNYGLYFALPSLKIRSIALASFEGCSWRRAQAMSSANESYGSSPHQLFTNIEF